MRIKNKKKVIIKQVEKVKGRKTLENLTQLELQNIKRLVQSREISYQKLNAYSTQAVDPQIKEIFTKLAQDALNTKQKLMSFLND